MENKPSARIPSLDGLRAISITLVLLAHIAGSRNAYSESVLEKYGPFGILGVRVFFAISGFLITSLLLKEIDRTGQINLRFFYARRMLRIFPAFYTFVATVTILSALGVFDIPRGDLLSAATFTENFRNGRWPTAHIWSLSVEEQYYLLWPSIVKFAGRVRACNLAALFIAVTPFAALLFYHFQLPFAASWFVNLGTIACGCLLAFTRNTLHKNSRYLAIIGSPWIALCPLFCVATLNWYGYKGFVARPIADLMICLVIDNVISVRSFVANWLNWRPIAFLGTLSYSLYLWQQIFFNRPDNRFFAAFPANICLAIAAGLTSYFLIEQPFLKLRDKFKPS